VAMHHSSKIVIKHGMVYHVNIFTYIKITFRDIGLMNGIID
jgi:hypothetical protein